MRMAGLIFFRGLMIGGLAVLGLGVLFTLTGCAALAESARGLADFISANSEVIPPGGPMDGMEWSELILWGLGLLAGGKAGELGVKRNIAAPAGSVV